MSNVVDVSANQTEALLKLTAYLEDTALRLILFRSTISFAFTIIS